MPVEQQVPGPVPTYVHPTCPKCGAAAIGTNEIVSCSGQIDFIREADGRIEHEYIGDTEVFWDSQGTPEGEKPYCCNHCAATLNLDELVFPKNAAPGQVANGNV